MSVTSFGLIIFASLGFAFAAIAAGNIGHKSLNKRDSGAFFEGIYEPSISTLEKNIQMIEEENGIRVFTKSDCELGLGGFYRPSANSITLFLDNANSLGRLIRTLYHLGVHRA